MVLATLGERDAEVAGDDSRRLDPDSRSIARRQAFGVAVRSLLVGVTVALLLWWYFVVRLRIYDV